MASPEPDKTRANIIGGPTEHTWAYLRSPIWPGTGLVDTDDNPMNFSVDHNTGYPMSLDLEDNPLPLLKAFQFKKAFGITYAWNLPLGVNFVEDTTWTPPDPNPLSLRGNIKPKLTLGFGVGSDAGSYVVYQGTQQLDNSGAPPGYTWTNVLGYDYETTKKALIGATVSVTCRFWPIPYEEDEEGNPPPPDEFTAIVPIDDLMFPENQNWSISGNRNGGLIIFVGSGNLYAYGPPTLFPPEPWTINWISMPS